VNINDKKLPEGWLEVPLPDVVFFQEGPGLRKYQYRETGIPFLNIRTIVEGRVDKSLCHCLDPKEVESKYPHFLLAVGDIICSTSGTIGKTAVIRYEDLPLMLNTSIIRFRAHCEDGPDTGFLYQYLNSQYFLDQAVRASTGTAQINVGPTHLKKMNFFLPPLAEQRRIVTKIEALQERSRRAQEALLEVGPLLEQFRQSVLAAAFRGDLTADWRAAHPHVEPASALLHRIRTERRHRWEQAELAKYEAKGQRPPNNWQEKYQEPEPVDDSDLSELPERWCWTSISELAKDERNSLNIGPFGSNLKVSDYTDSGVPLVFVREIRAQRFGDQNTKFVTPEKAAQLASHQVQGGDLLITKMGDPPGDTAIYPEGFPNAVITADCIKLAPKPAITSSLFLKYWLRAAPAKEKILEETKGVAQRKLSLKRFRDIVLPLPPISEQEAIIRQIDASLEPGEEIKNACAAVLCDLNRLDQSILAKAFRGELIPQDPNDEPASALLERIRAQREQQAAATKRQQKTATPQWGNKTEKTSSRLTPQQLTLAGVLVDKGQTMAQNS
jgi:type I restriction enzyme S subunit